VEASSDFAESGMNLVIHEFAHKIDMRNGEANGCPPLHPGMPVVTWRDVMSRAYDDFCRRVERAEETAIDPYAAEDPAEFFAVLSEVFFAQPATLHAAYPDVYRQFAQFYRQDPHKPRCAPPA
jgi:MtfA peptidase